MTLITTLEIVLLQMMKISVLEMRMMTVILSQANPYPAGKPQAVLMTHLEVGTQTLQDHEVADLLMGLPPGGVVVGSVM
jgi:hypothetical protein